MRLFSHVMHSLKSMYKSSVATVIANPEVVSLSYE